MFLVLVLDFEIDDDSAWRPWDWSTNETPWLTTVTKRLDHVALFFGELCLGTYLERRYDREKRWEWIQVAIYSKQVCCRINSTFFFTIQFCTLVPYFGLRVAHCRYFQIFLGLLSFLTSKANKSYLMIRGNKIGELVRKYEVFIKLIWTLLILAGRLRAPLLYLFFKRN